MINALSETLKTRRKELGLTLLQIAERMGVTEATVQRWESGDIKTIRQDRIGQLAEILYVAPARLMGWPEETKETAAPKDDGLTAQEQEFIQLLRLLPESSQAAILQQLQGLVLLKKDQGAP